MPKTSCSSCACAPCCPYATALRALEEVYEQTRREGSLLLLAGIHAQPLIAMDRAGLLDRVGVDNVFENVNDALKRARVIVGMPEPGRRESLVQEVAWERPPENR